jgi:hypothetical protein
MVGSHDNSPRIHLAFCSGWSSNRTSGLLHTVATRCTCHLQPFRAFDISSVRNRKQAHPHIGLTTECKGRRLGVGNCDIGHQYDKTTHCSRCSPSNYNLNSCCRTLADRSALAHFSLGSRPEPTPRWQAMPRLVSTIGPSCLAFWIPREVKKLKAELPS